MHIAYTISTAAILAATFSCVVAQADPLPNKAGGTWDDGHKPTQGTAKSGGWDDSIKPAPKASGAAEFSTGVKPIDPAAKGGGWDDSIKPVSPAK